MPNPQFLKQDNEESLFLITSNEWRQFIEFIKKRSKRFQFQINEAVERGDIVEAKIKLALMKESQRQVDTFVQQTLQQKKELANGN